MLGRACLTVGGSRACSAWSASSRISSAPMWPWPRSGWCRRSASPWRDETAAALTDLRSRADAAHRAHTRLEHAIAAAHGLLRVSSAGLEPLAATKIASAEPATAALSQWSGGAKIADPLALAAHLEQQVDGVITALDALRTDVHDELKRREDLWQPMATELRDWVPQALAADAAQTQVSQLKKGESWFKGVQADMRIRNSRSRMAIISHCSGRISSRRSISGTRRLRESSSRIARR